MRQFYDSVGMNDTGFLLKLYLNHILNNDAFPGKTDLLKIASPPGYKSHTAGSIVENAKSDKALQATAHH